MYRLAPNIKVRDESFGLLFYLCRSADLVFINSGNLLKAADLRFGISEGKLFSRLGESKNETLRKLISKLEARGLIIHD
jgi:putative mycofactocin binding protein MftB